MEVIVDVGKNATDMVSGLATQLNMSVSEVLPYYVKAAQLTAISEVAALCTIFYGIFRLTKKGYKFFKGVGLNDNAAPIVVLLALLGMVVTAICLTALPHSLTTAISPQAHAISDMINDASKLLGK